MPLQRILYRSDIALEGTSEEVGRQLHSIVEAAQLRNLEVGLTGALMSSAGVFIQALEGPIEAVECTFERICCDLRHRRVRLLEFTTADHRVFDGWSMAQVAPTGELARIGAAFDADNARVDSVSAEGVIQVMRSLLLAGTPMEARSRA